MDLVVQSVAGVIYPVAVQSLVIQGIVAIHIGIGVMDNSMDEWSLVQSVEGSWDTSSVISPPLQFRPKSASLQREPLPQGGNERYWVLGTVFSSATLQVSRGFQI